VKGTEAQIIGGTPDVDAKSFQWYCTFSTILLIDLETLHVLRPLYAVHCIMLASPKETQVQQGVMRIYPRAAKQPEVVI